MALELSTAQSVLGALLIALVLAVLHLGAPRIRKLPFIPESATGSFAGGLAVAYVFLHLLPEIAEGNEAIGEALSQVLRPTPLIDLGIFLVALAGFTAFYGLERLAQHHGGSRGVAEAPRSGVRPGSAASRGGAAAVSLAAQARTDARVGAAGREGGPANPAGASTCCTWARSWCTTR